MKNKTAFIIFAHSTLHTIEDVDDMINNISQFHDNCEFMINHPTLNHPKIRMRHMPGVLNQSNFIFGALESLIRDLSNDEINEYEHFSLISANQYFINDINFEKGVNYIQYLNTENWEETYQGKNTDTTVQGFPLQQPYGRWDMKDLYKEYNIEIPMSANWECMTLTKETMLLAKIHLNKCVEYYPNQDMINIFLPYMAIMTGQKWKYPAHFGTYDPSNPQPKNWILSLGQIIGKREDGYISVKRTNYNKDCPLKDYIRNNFYK
jgi:hypothetical protein